MLYNVRTIIMLHKSTKALYLKVYFNNTPFMRSPVFPPNISLQVEAASSSLK